MYSNPYTDLTFFGFLGQLFLRLWGFITGNEALHLATDEIQMIVLCCVAASSALVGSFLVLRKMTMMANSLSHTILVGIVIAFLITQADMHVGVFDPYVLLIAALIMGLLTAFLTEFFCKVARLQEDASTGIVFTSLFALGIMLVTMLTRNAHIGAEVVMGNVDALHFDDCKLVLGILVFNIIIILCFFKEFKMTTFDPAFAKALGISATFFNYLLMMQVATTVIGAFKAIGVLMVLAMMTGPILTARLLTHELKKMIFLAVVFGCSASILGVAFSRHILSYYGLALSTAGLVICTIGVQFLIVLACHPEYGLLRHRYHEKTQSNPLTLQLEDETV